MPVLHIPYLSALITIVTGITGRSVQQQPRHTHTSDTSCTSYTSHTSDSIDAEEDALLDVQIRSLLKDDYDRAGPNPYNYDKVLQAIEAYSHRQHRLAHGNGPMSRGRYTLHARYRQAVSLLYREGLKPYGARLITGSIVAALLILAVGPQVSGVLSGYGGYRAERNLNYEMSSETDANQPLNLDPEAYTRKLQIDLNQERIHPDTTATTDDNGDTGGRAHPQQQVSPVPDYSPHIRELEMKTGEDLHTYVPAEAPTLDPFEYGLINRAGSSSPTR